MSSPSSNFSLTRMNQTKPKIFSTTTSSAATQPPETTTATTRAVTTAVATAATTELTTTAGGKTDSVNVAVIILSITTALLLIVVIFFIYRRMLGKEIIPECLRLRQSSKPPTDPDRDYVDPNIVLQHAAGRQHMVRQNNTGGHFSKSMPESPQLRNEPHAYIDLVDHNNQPYRSKVSDKMANAQTTVDPVYSSIDPATYSNVADVYHVLES